VQTTSVKQKYRKEVNKTSGDGGRNGDGGGNFTGKMVD